MNIAAKSLRGTGLLAVVGALVAFSGSTVASTLNLQDIPLYLPGSVPPLNMLVLGRDHKLYYEAYNDYTDLNDDGQIDLKYKPGEIDYYGYFDSFKCYTHDGSLFNPARKTTDKTCNGSEWSGDFLNYLTTSRIDALRKVLYGGYRSKDTTTETVLERSFIPQDAHSWGKEYTSVANDGYDITKYAPLALPAANRRHLFANTTPKGTANPLLRILKDRPERIWNWVSIERPVAGNDVVNSSGERKDRSGIMTDLIVRVKVCVSDALKETDCKGYGSSGNMKPIGLLQEFGENDSMYFGLLSGSYEKNTSGGVLRREISSIREEINKDTGQFRNGVYKGSTLTANQGIITTLNRLSVTGFGGDYVYDCGWDAAARPINAGECQMWGNPIGEMMYESLRYFSGIGKATDAFTIDYGAGEESKLAGGGLPVATWDDPYASPRPVCAKPFQTVISDINPSYDSDEVPGTAFGSFSSDDLPGLNVATLGKTIWDQEFGATKSVFIGDNSVKADGAPTVKDVSSFGNIRGLSPEEPTKQGSYSSASVAYHGRKTDINTTVAGKQAVSTFAVALASPLPQIKIPVGSDCATNGPNCKTITLVPFAKSVSGSGISATADFQPTDQIVDFYVDTLTSTYGRFRVNFEDVEQGADHDMDAITVYEYTVSGGNVTVKLTSEYAAGGITQHMGYVISGTTKDGIYLEVVDQRDGDVANDTDFKLDTPPAFTGTPPAPSTGIGTWNDGVALPFVATRTFTPGSSSGASILKDPLWYAAKWGGYDESFYDVSNGPVAAQNDIPDEQAEWDTDKDGTPDNYFLVTNALKLSEQLRKAFENILKTTTSSSSASVNSGSISSGTRVYQARFDTGEWTGQLLSYRVDEKTGALVSSLDDPDATKRTWDASGKLPDHASRNIFTTNTNRTQVPFQWLSLDATRQGQVVSDSVVKFLRGDASNEGKTTGKFRVRKSKLGDIISSSPLFVGAPPFRYSDKLESKSYTAFTTAHANRPAMVYAGANDGMLHGFDASTGVETFAFIPRAVFPRLKNLASPTYKHQYFVDGPASMGDVFINGDWQTALVGGLNKGGQEIYALNITDPSSTSTPPTVMWEFTDTDTNPDAAIQNGDPDLGLTYSQPSIVRLRNGQWAAIFGNGYNSRENDGSFSTTGNAVLYIVDMATGNLIRKLDTGVGMGQAPTGVTWDNGLSTPALVDLNNDRIVEYAFAGDLYGNMWKFDLSSTDSAKWNVAFDSAPLYQARGPSGIAQPITSRPEVGRGPAGQGMIVLFGTGKYLEASDKLIPSPAEVQTFYGIVDKNLGGAGPTDRSQLVAQTILAEVLYDPDGSGSLPTVNVRATSKNVMGTKQGWYLDLKSPSKGYQGERQVSNPIVRNGNVIFTTMIPDIDPCKPGGKSWIMEMSMLDGSRLEASPFDINNDGKFTSDDNVPVKLDDGTTIYVPLSGIGKDEILQSPGVLDGNFKPADAADDDPGEPVQYKYMPGSSGGIQRITENPGSGGVGRQSWRQIR